MKTIASAAAIVVALACWDCAAGASSAKTPEASKRATVVQLPKQFLEDWKVGLCCSSSGTGLVQGDRIAIEQRPGLKITLSGPHSGPDPTLLEKVTLTLVNPENAPSDNVLSLTEHELLCCRGDAEGFGEKLWHVLMQHNFELAYLAGAGQLDPADPKERAEMVFLPYLIKDDPSKTRHFLLAVVDPEKHRLHNGIVHGQP